MTERAQPCFERESGGAFCELDSGHDGDHHISDFTISVNGSSTTQRAIKDARRKQRKAAK